MTRYEQGFMNKCAEYGVDAGTAMGLLEKRAWGSKSLGISPEADKSMSLGALAGGTAGTYMGVRGFNKAMKPIQDMLRTAGESVPKIPLWQKLILPGTMVRGAAGTAGGAALGYLLYRLLRNRNHSSPAPGSGGGK